MSQKKSNVGWLCKDFGRAFNKMTEENQKDFLSPQINIKINAFGSP